MKFHIHSASMFLALSLFLMAGCSEQAPDAAADAAHNSANALDWDGSYTGIVPCADCEGIATTLTLERSGNYTLRTQYLGKSEEVMQSTGEFAWEADGNRLRLRGTNGAADRFQVGEGQLFQLDPDGGRISGALAEKYILRKVGTAQAWPLMDTYWKLVELMGNAVEQPEGFMPAHMILSEAENRVAGNAGCNGFFSSYELDTAKGLLRFQQAGSTMMACPDMSVENAFHKALPEVDGYTLSGGELSLTKGGSTTLMRFEAVDM